MMSRDKVRREGRFPVNVGAFALTLSVLLPLLTGFTTVNPATDEREVIFISPEKERAMGKRFHGRVLKHFDMPVDPLLEEKVKGIGEELAEVSDRKEIIYTFTVLNHDKDRFYNAFAAPGGYVYIFDDLVNALEDEGQIASVLAHEMGHIEAKHAIKRFQGDIGATLLMLLGMNMNKETGDFQKANRALGQLMSEYSRSDEEQADLLAVKYMKASGFDPEEAVNALKKMQELRKKGPRRKYSSYRTHPYYSERISYIEKQIKGHMDFDAYINIVSQER